MHCSAVIRAPGELGHSLTVVAERELLPHRRALGWPIPDFGSARLIVAPGEEEMREVVRGSETDSVHISIGIRHKFCGAVAANCRRYGRRLGIYPEAPHPDGLLLPLKWMLYAWQRLTRARTVDFLMPIGRTCEAWYRACGYPAGRLFPCAYAADFVASPVSAAADAEAGGPYRVLFVGRCLRLERVDLLLEALAAQRNRDWKCTLVGDGPEKPRWQALAAQRGLDDRAEFLPSMPYQEALAMIRVADLLVLPSAREGWGAVINEALMSGVPAICSDRCGAADLLTEPWRGGVFRGGDRDSLAGALAARLREGPISLGQRRRIQEWSVCVQGPALARYVSAVLSHVYAGAPRPEPPWLAAASHRPIDAGRACCA